MAAECTRNTPPSSPIQAELAHQVAAGCTRIPSAAPRRPRPPSVVTNRFTERPAGFLTQGLSVATCLHTIRREGRSKLPSQRTVYDYITRGEIVQPTGCEHYKPKKRRVPPKPRGQEKCAPGARALTNAHRKSFCANALTTGRGTASSGGKGGLFILFERRNVLIRPLRAISQRTVHRPLATSSLKAFYARFIP